MDYRAEAAAIQLDMREHDREKSRSHRRQRDQVVSTYQLPNQLQDTSACNLKDHEERVLAALERERVKRDARQRLDAEDRGPIVLPALEMLRDRLARPAVAIRERIARWQPRDTRVLAAAQFKSGKTTLISNLVRSLVDGDLFLGRETVDPIDGVVADLDFEMGSAQLDAWYRAQRIRNDDRVLLISMRGRATTFNLLDDHVRSEWARRLQDQRVTYLILDCVRPILDALGLDEHHDAGRFLVAFDALLAEAGITEACVVHHMGHTGERSRGDSRLRDWPDVEWRLMRRDEDPASARYITAYGRDVDVPESQLVYDALTRRLTIETGSRRDAAGRDALDAILTVLDGPEIRLSGRAIKDALNESEHARAAIESALRLGIQKGALKVEAGPHRSKLYQRVSVPVSRSVPPDTGTPSVPVSQRLYSAGHGTLPSSASNDPNTGTLATDEVIDAGRF